MFVTNKKEWVREEKTILIVINTKIAETKSEPTGLKVASVTLT